MDVMSGFNIVVFFSIYFVDGQRFCSTLSKGVYSNMNIVKHLYTIKKNQCTASVPVLREPGLCSAPKTAKGVVIRSCDWIAKPIIALSSDWVNGSIIRQDMCSDIAQVEVNILCHDRVLGEAVGYVIQDNPRNLDPLPEPVEVEYESKLDTVPKTVAPIDLRDKLNGDGVWMEWRKLNLNKH